MPIKAPTIAWEVEAGRARKVRKIMVKAEARRATKASRWERADKLPKELRHLSPSRIAPSITKVAVMNIAVR
jgi:hypothetical protein